MATLGKYELHEILGKGGFGTVYRATDLTLERVVAIKVLHPQLTVDPEFIERFGREARLMAKTEHPNIVGIYEVGEAQGRFFIAMRYLPGGSLAARLQRGPLALEDIQGILGQVCSGLNELHRQGFVHRDLKPANILFDANNQAVVTDFGLARAVQMSSSSSSSGTAGTPFYRAPELWRGKPPASPATDVYSLGCILGEMLTSRPLFGGDTPDEVLTKHLIDGPDFGEPWPPEGVPNDLAKVVAKALQRDPAQRYPDAQEFAFALAGVASRAQEDARRKAEEAAADQARIADEERARQAAEELARRQAADREKARLAAEAEAQREAEAREREKDRLETEARARRDAEEQARRERDKLKSVEETEHTSQSEIPKANRVESWKSIPPFGCFLVFLVLLILLTIWAIFLPQ